MSGRLIWIALAASVAANVFFAAGLAYSIYTGRRVAESPAARVDLVADRLGLNEAQRAGLKLLRERAAVRRSGLHEARAPTRAAIVEEILRPAFDRARVLALIDEWGADRRLYFAEFAEDLHGYLATLSPEQRARFVEMSREPGFLRHIFRAPRGDR